MSWFPWKTSPRKSLHISGVVVRKYPREQGRKDCNMHLKNTSTILFVTGVMTMKMNLKSRRELTAHNAKVNHHTACPFMCWMNILRSNNVLVLQGKSTYCFIWRQGSVMTSYIFKKSLSKRLCHSSRPAARRRPDGRPHRLLVILHLQPQYSIGHLLRCHTTTTTTTTTDDFALLLFTWDWVGAGARHGSGWWKYSFLLV